jgi:hypothetical protein
MAYLDEETVMLIGRMDEKLDALLLRSADHDRRIKTLENSRVRLAGVIVGIGGTMAWLSHDKIMPLLALLSIK